MDFANYRLYCVKLRIMMRNFTSAHWRSPYADVLTARLVDEPRRFIQVLAGPRQVGKTTLAMQVVDLCAAAAHYATADDPVFRGAAWIEEQWHLGRVQAWDNPSRGAILVLDEIQKVPGWSETVKCLWDEDSRNGTNLRVVLLGSSPLLVGRGLTESLAGRFEMVRISHWSYGEMRAAFGWDWQSYILFGGYPGSAGLIGDPWRLMQYVRDSIVEATVARDILSLTDVRRPALLRRLFELACEYASRELSFSKMLGQLQDKGNSMTLAHYLNLLSDAGMVAGLQKFGRDGKLRASSPKLQPLNTGLITAVAGREPEYWLDDRAQWGRLVESAVGAHLLNWAFSTARGEVFYWRDHRGREVDFVLRSQGKVMAVEVKSGVARASRTRGLSYFADEYPSVVPLPVGGDGIPLDEFLESDVEQWFPKRS